MPSLANSNPFGSFQPFTPSGLTKPMAPTWSQNTPRPTAQGVNEFMSFLDTGKNVDKKLMTGAPSFEDYQKALMRDFAEANRTTQATWQQNKEATDRVLQANLASAEQLRNYQNPFFDQAQKEQRSLLEQTKADREAFERKSEEAQRSLQQQNQAAIGAFGSAAAEARRGEDMVASSMAQAIAKRKEAAALNAQTQFAGILGGTESQLGESIRQQNQALDQTLFASLGELQMQGAKTVADIQTQKASTMASMAQNTANFKAGLMGMGADQAKSVQNAIKLGYDTAMFRGQDYAQRMDMAAKLESAGYSNWAQGIKDNPVMGVNILPTLLNINYAAQLTGGSRQQQDLENKARQEFYNIQYSPALTGGSNPGNRATDLNAIIQSGLNVSGMSPESVAAIRQRGRPEFSPLRNVIETRR